MQCFKLLTTMSFDIQQIEILHLQLPLKFNFKSAKATLSKRDTLLIKVKDNSGLTGYGEVVAFTEPFYTNETLSSALNLLKTKYIPELLAEKINHPFDVHAIFDLSSPMALAGLENALLDLYAKRHNKNLIEMLFEEKLSAQIDVGIALGDMPYAQLEHMVAKYVEQGCKRFKFKIFPSADWSCLKKLQQIRQKFPNLIMLADANASYSFNKTHMEELKAYNDLNLACIEEVFDLGARSIHHYNNDDFDAYVDAMQQLQFKICHDESLLSLEDMHKAFEQKILKMINIKIGRLGGLFYITKVIDFCRKHHIPYFIGSMVESGISKILHVQLAALEGAYIAGDLSDSARYFEQDLITPPIVSRQGKILVPRGIGIGVQIDKLTLKKYTKNEWYFGIDRLV